MEYTKGRCCNCYQLLEFQREEGEIIYRAYCPVCKTVVLPSSIIIIQTVLELDMPRRILNENYLCDM